MTTIPHIRQVKHLPHIEETPVIEIFHTTVPTDNWLDDLPDDDETLLSETEGAGLIVYLHRGNREWFKTSVSKTPLNYLKKSLPTLDYTYFTNAILIRGTSDYPMTEKEAKSLSGMIYESLKTTPIAGFTSYTTISAEDNPHTTLILNNALKEILTLIESYGFDLTQTHTEAQTSEELKTGTELITINGLKVNITTKLKNEHSPEEGLKYVSVKITTAQNEPIIYTSTGFIDS